MAEALGSVLLQPLCAVVPVPRQEDWGIFDAVATILQSEGDFLFAEQSFFIQFKAPTAKPMRYDGQRLKTLMGRELAFFVGRIDMKRSEIEIYDTSGVLLHLNARDADEIEIRLGQGKWQVTANRVLGYLSKPILRWQLSALLDPSFRKCAYEVLGDWLSLDQERRSLYQLGIMEEVSWETNERPAKTGTTSYHGNTEDTRIPRELAASIRLITILAAHNLELIQSAQTLVQWARKRGADTDPGGVMLWMALYKEAQHRAKLASERFSDATDFLAIVINCAGPDWLDFWLIPELGAAMQRRGNFSELEDLGFEIEVNQENNIAVNLTLGEKWLSKYGFEQIGMFQNVFALRKLLNKLVKNEAPPPTLSRPILPPLEHE